MRLAIAALLINTILLLVLYASTSMKLENTQALLIEASSIAVVAATENRDCWKRLNDVVKGTHSLRLRTL